VHLSLSMLTPSLTPSSDLPLQANCKVERVTLHDVLRSFLLGPYRMARRAFNTCTLPARCLFH
jgi:hypothetical protein